MTKTVAVSGYTSVIAVAVGNRGDPLLGFSVNRSATVRPLVPPPIITKSYKLLNDAPRPMIRAL